MEKKTWMLIPSAVLGHSDLGLLRSIGVLLRDCKHVSTISFLGRYHLLQGIVNNGTLLAQSTATRQSYLEVPKSD